MSAKIIETSLEQQREILNRIKVSKKKKKVKRNPLENKTMFEAFKKAGLAK